MTSFARVDDAPPTDPPTLRISRALVPALWWRNVPVIQLEPVELSELDRFVVEAAAKLGRLDAAEFEELTGLPELVFTALGRRLGALELVGWRGHAVTAHPRVTAAPTELTATRRTTAALDLLYLPEHDDLVAVKEGLDDFERTGPPVADMAAIPTGLHGTTRRQLLERKLPARDVANLPPHTVGLAGSEDDDEPLTAMAGARPRPPLPVVPAIDAAGTVVFEGAKRRATLEVSSRSRRGRRAKGGNGQEAVTASLDVSGASGLVDSWCAVPRRLAAPEHRAAVLAALASVPLDAGALGRDGEHRWSVTLTGSQAVALSARQLLTRPVGVEVREPRAWVRVAARFLPGDRDADRLFARDQVVQRLLAAPAAVARVMADEATAVDLAGGPDAVRDRAWNLGHYWIVHALREPADFAYT